mmetsp:Transcript_7270/g.21075  ORF Transcript_7270/g.21075 Transcript_7270/m.21075 type:complete len:504 (+) Transcript_7270:412-1923(+)
MSIQSQSCSDKMSDSSTNEIASIEEEGAEALAAAVGIPPDEFDFDDDSTGNTINLEKLIHAEVNPPKSLVLIWILFAAELGFDLITTAIAFFSTIGKQDCCGHTVYMGPMPVTTSIPFFFLIMAEITFLGRAILLTLWPSVFEARRLEFHGPDAAGDDGCDEIALGDHHVGFEVTLTTSDEESKSCSENDQNDSDANTNDNDNENDNDNDNDSGSRNDNEQDTEGQTEEDESANQPEGADTETDTDPSKSKDEEATEPNESESPSATFDADQAVPQDEDKDKDEDEDETETETPHRDRPPVFVDTSAPLPQQSWLKRTCCCFLRWNARMVLCVLNLLTLLNPFFGCLLAYILLYQSDKTECFVVLGIESLSIILHFVSVRMEGGLRTWYSRALHSLALLPFLVSVIMVLVFLREGGMCYSVQTELFMFSGCEVCPDTLQPPVEGNMCGNQTLDGIGGLQHELQNLGDSFKSVGSLKNIANLAKRGAEQDTYCSSEVSFCFYEF